ERTERLVALPRPAAVRAAERRARRSPRHRLPADPAAQAGRKPVGRGGDQRDAAWVLSPVPGLRRLRRQRDHGHHLRHALPALAARYPDDYRPHADRRGGVHRLCTLGRSRFLAGVGNWAHFWFVTSLGCFYSGLCCNHLIRAFISHFALVRVPLDAFRKRPLSYRDTHTLNSSERVKWPLNQPPVPCEGRGRACLQDPPPVPKELAGSWRCSRLSRQTSTP